MTNVYFIQVAQEDGRGPIKIGKADRVVQRLGELQVGNPFKLELLAVAKDVPDSLEAVYHARFSTARMRGEWFRPTDELLAFIEEVKAGDPDPEPPVPPAAEKTTDEETEAQAIERLKWEDSCFQYRRFFGPVEPLGPDDYARWAEVRKILDAHRVRGDWEKRKARKGKAKNRRAKPDASV